MIVFDLICADGHGFEGWFGSSVDFALQQQRGQVACPQCGSSEVSKAPMAPAVGRKNNQMVTAPGPARRDLGRPDPGRPDPRRPDPKRQVANSPMPPQVAAALGKLAQAQALALKDSTWVGKAFADQSRAMHYGERDHAPIHGQATMAEAQALADEGVAVAPLPFPVAPPDELN